MKPRIFLSSTIKDLLPVRESIRDAINELGYEPVMSDHGEIGYLPDATAEESCYTSLENCDILVVVIGKRYGNIGKDGNSITHNEVRKARDLGMPVYCFLNRDINLEINLFSNNRDLVLEGYDDPAKLFSFIQEIATADKSNSVIEYSSSKEASSKLKLQFSHLFQHLLAQKNDLLRTSISELLEELRTFRYSLPPEQVEESAGLMTVTKYFCEDLEEVMFMEDRPRHHLLRIVLAAGKNFDESIWKLLRANSFRAFMESVGANIMVMDFDESRKKPNPGPHTGQILVACNGPIFGMKSNSTLHYGLFPNMDFHVHEDILRELESCHFELKSLYTRRVRDVAQAIGKAQKSEGR